MKDFKQLESLINSSIESYKTGFNMVNTDYEIDFNVTLTTHKVEVESVSRDVAYLRVERAIKPIEAGDDEWENLLIYNQAYKFRNIAEQTDPKSPWKYDLYLDLLHRLICGGIEYAELMKRMQQTVQAEGGKPLGEAVISKPEIIVTNQMPAPLNDNDKAYLEWVKKQKN